MSTAVTLHPGPLAAACREALEALEARDIARRIYQRDHRVWRPQPDEIADRLGWLDCPTSMPARLDEIGHLVESARQQGYTHALLLGMGGSSLAPEVFRRLFGAAAGFLDLDVLDSTHPETVLAKALQLDWARTLFLPATKSGGTVETLSLLKYFYRQAVQHLGAGEAGAHFVAITDPGSGLAELARQLGFRHTFLNDPHIGGRYSALSFFGLVAAGLLGIDVKRVLARAGEAAAATRAALELGAFMGAGAHSGRDKLTLLSSPALGALGAWIEQLVAESTGKEGKGILPVDGEDALPPAAYGRDRLFVYMRLGEAADARARALVAAGHPLLQFDLGDLHDLGAAFFQWELATAIAGHLLDIQPFDQPDVEAAKVLARDMVQTYQRQGHLPDEPPLLRERGLAVYGDEPAQSLGEALEKWLARARADRSYIALHAYLHPTAAIQEGLRAVRRRLQERSGLATTLGFGPRFLHSTGQLHKGDGGHGLFLQLTDAPAADAPIPDDPHGDTSSLSFGVLIAAQAAGDRRALRRAGRAVLRIHLGDDPVAGLGALLGAIPPPRQTRETTA